MSTIADDPRCPECDGPMEMVVINGHDSWACPVDAYAYSVNQDDEGWELE